MARFTQLNHKEAVKNQYKNLFRQTRMYLLSQKDYLEYRSKIQESNSYKRLTQYNREFMRGMEEVHRDNLYQTDLVFCYDYKGKRYAIDSIEYKAISPSEICENHTFKGHCYRKDLNKCYF